MQQPKSFHCAVCGFDVEGAERCHKRKVHQKETVVRFPDTGDVETIMSRIFTFFNCSRCAFAHIDPVRLQEHTVRPLLPFPSPVSPHPPHFPPPSALRSPFSASFRAASPA
ncbi:hypothetical protein DFH09DRAFT_1308907 [Mycena vulgaris]|nr:hypothetical protein DFH09DRAFT_1308907 [Mycena vulgaris]